MVDINIDSQKEIGDGWLFDVRLSEGDFESSHQVGLAKSDWQRLAGQQPPAKLVHRAFRFLLEREPKESILGRFDMTVVSRYFPEFEDEIRL